jgi:YHYH protein
MRRTVTGLLVALGMLVALAAPAAAHEDDAGTVDETRLPVGKTSTAPTIGSYWSCQTSFDPNAGGAHGDLPWLNGDGTWDATKKTTVDGHVAWPDAELTVKRHGATRVITTKDLPTDHTTGVFPIDPSDDAYKSDHNPNSIQNQDFRLEIPAHPKTSDEPSCGGGEVGILKSGVLLFSPIDAGGRDAVAYEVQDECNGHPQVSGAYHYHNVSPCVLAELDKGTGQSKLVGWAFDGFGIYGPRDAKGHELTSADLDECHGTTSTVVFNGKKQRMYH